MLLHVSVFTLLHVSIKLDAIVGPQLLLVILPFCWLFYRFAGYFTVLLDILPCGMD